MEVDMYVAIAQFPTVPAERDMDFLDWFALANDQLRETAGLISRRLLRAPDGSYTALVEHESASTFAAMQAAEAVSMIQEGLGKILSDCPQATGYVDVVDFSTAETCCGDGTGTDSREGTADTHVSGGCRHAA
jgi:hypothetical protein